MSGSVEAPKTAAPKLSVPKPVVPKPTVPETKAPAAAPTPAPVAAPTEFPLEEAPTGPRPSVAYLIMAVISLICLIYATLLITVQFLDLTQGQKVADQIPEMVLPRAK